MRPIILCIATVAIILIAGCKKDATTSLAQIKGTYAGTVSYSNTNPAVDYYAISGSVKITLAATDYTTLSPFANFSADANGSYAVTDQYFTFKDNTVHTANFDWGLILNGQYTYTTKNDSLFLVKKSGDNVYTYKLKKQ